MPPMTQLYKPTGRRGGAEPQPRPVARGSWRGGNRVSAPSVARHWRTSRTCTCTTWFPSNAAARTILRISGWYTTPATANFTAPVRLLGYVDGLSRVPGDRSARFCGEGVIAISPPYPTSYRLYYGELSRAYHTVVPTGRETTLRVDGLTVGETYMGGCGHAAAHRIPTRR